MNKSTILKLFILVGVMLAGIVLVLVVHTSIAEVRVLGQNQVTEGFIWRTISGDWKGFISKDRKLKIGFESCGSQEDWAFTCLDDKGNERTFEFVNIDRKIW